MDDVVAFVRNYCRAELEARKAALTDSNNDKVMKKIRVVYTFFDGASPGIEIPMEIGEDEREVLKALRERILFVVREFGKGKMYQALLSEEYDRGVVFLASLFITNKKGEPKIVSRYNICVTCDASGIIKGKKCPECKGQGIRTKLSGQAVDLLALGPATAVKKLRAPEMDEQLATYNSW